MIFNFIYSELEKYIYQPDTYDYLKTTEPFIYTYFNKINKKNNLNIDLHQLTNTIKINKISFIIKNNYKIKFPDEYSKTDLKNIDYLIQNTKNNEYKYLSLWWKVCYYDFKDKNNLLDIYKYLLKQDPSNPDLLARISRYIGVILYKRNHQDKRFMIEAIKYLKQSINYRLNILKNIELIPSYTFARLWYAYMELNLYEKAEKYYNEAIKLNKNLNFLNPEPLIRKAFLFNLEKKYIESLNILLYIEKKHFNDRRNKFHHDVRFFKRIADNFIELKQKEKALNYLLKTIKLYLENDKYFYFIVNNQNHKINCDNLDDLIHILNLQIPVEFKKNCETKILYLLNYLYEKHLKKKNIIEKDWNIGILCYKFLKNFS